MDINRQASERTGRVMLLFISLVFLIRDSETCTPVEKQHTVDTAPTLAFSTIEFPDEHVLPVGSNVTFICTSNSSKKDYDNPYFAQPYWMQFYFNHGNPFIKQCGGRTGDGVDNEASKVCTFFIENATKSDSGIYKCRSYNQMSCTQGTIQLDFQEPLPPTLNVDLPHQLDFIVGSKANFTCQASGVPRPAITWVKNGHRVPRSSVKGVKGHSMLTFEPVRREDEGEYWCEANSSVGWNRSSTATLTVLWKPIFTTHPKSKAVDFNNSVAMVTLQCAAEGLPPPMLTWLKNNSTVVKEIAFQNGSVSSLDLVFQEISTDDLKYRCLATNSAGKTLSQEATLTIEENSTASTGSLPTGIVAASSTDSLPTGNVAASSTDSLPEFLWPLVGIVALTILALLIIFIVMKQKRWNKANSQRNLEAVKEQHEFIQLQITNGINMINQLRNSHSDSSMNSGSTQDTTISTTEGQEEVISSELYLQGMDTINRNWEIPRNRLVITDEKLGGGEFGIVTKGVYLRTDGIELPVAVKKLKDDADQQERMALIHELETLIRVGRHPNIVSLVGACTFEEPLCVVIEFVSGGSLDAILRSSHVQTQQKDPPYANIWSRLTERELLKIASDVAKGMRYLESKQCIHRDLASRNILVGNGLVAKVADFGMSRDISTDGQYTKTSQGRIPWLWMSLEALRGICTTKGDVWSFGVVLWEIVTLGALPYKGVKGLIELHELLLSGVRLEKPAHCSEELYDVMLRCWQQSPDDRPTFEELLVILQEILDAKERTYINVTFFEGQEDMFQDSTLYLV